MAKRLNTVNFVYTTIGLAVAAGAGYYAWRALRNRRAAAGTTSTTPDTQEKLMDIRRSTRKAGRAVKDTVKQVGKNLKRGASDVGESWQEVADSGSEIAAEQTGYTRV